MHAWESRVEVVQPDPVTQYLRPQADGSESHQARKLGPHPSAGLKRHVPSTMLANAYPKFVSCLLCTSLITD